ncbi:MAG: ACT domain-containing protein, partial [Acidimicrobiia bacterium]|nr:ACT domain-containing protein [Acidimicrobiia bacterium]
EATKEGRLQLDRALRREGITRADLNRLARAGTNRNGTPRTLDAIAQDMNFADLEALQAAIGDNRLSAETAAARIAKELVATEDRAPTPPIITRTSPRARRDPTSAGVRVEGYDDVFVRLSRCCTPVPGDRIMGFVTRGRGVSVHRTDCANAESLASSQLDRLIDVEWDSDGKADSFVVSLEVKAYDRTHLLADVYQAVSDQHINILSSASSTSEDRIAKLTFEFEISDPAHLDWLIRAIRQVDGVYDVYRMMMGQPVSRAAGR